jgi:hypothetical protein
VLGAVKLPKMDIAVLMNQLVMMKALLSLVQDAALIKQLKEQIVFTEARIRAAS